MKGGSVFAALRQLGRGRSSDSSAKGFDKISAVNGLLKSGTIDVVESKQEESTFEIRFPKLSLPMTITKEKNMFCYKGGLKEFELKINLSEKDAERLMLELITGKDDDPTKKLQKLSSLVLHATGAEYMYKFGNVAWQLSKDPKAFLDNFFRMQTQADADMKEIKDRLIRLQGTVGNVAKTLGVEASEENGGSNKDNGGSDKNGSNKDNGGSDKDE